MDEKWYTARWKAALGIVEYFARLLDIPVPDRHSPDWQQMKDNATRALKIQRYVNDESRKLLQECVNHYEDGHQPHMRMGTNWWPDKEFYKKAKALLELSP